MAKRTKDESNPVYHKTPAKIPINDIYLSSFQTLNGNEPEVITVGTRAVFMFNADETFYAICQRYNENEQVSVVDFVNALRHMRALMLSKRNPQ